MRLPDWTPTLRRRLTLALLPFRAAVTVAAAWAAKVAYDNVGTPPPPGPPAADLLWALLLGVMIGVDLIIVTLVAVFVWYPLPPADRR